MPKRASAWDLSRNQSHTSLRPMAWESWAKSIVPKWLFTLNFLAWASMPVSRAWVGRRVSETEWDVLDLLTGGGPR